MVEKNVIYVTPDEHLMCLLNEGYVIYDDWGQTIQKVNNGKYEYTSILDPYERIVDYNYYTDEELIEELKESETRLYYFSK